MLEGKVRTERTGGRLPSLSSSLHSPVEPTASASDPQTNSSIVRQLFPAFVSSQTSLSAIHINFKTSVSLVIMNALPTDKMKLLDEMQDALFIFECLKACNGQLVVSSLSFGISFLTPLSSFQPKKSPRTSDRKNPTSSKPSIASAKNILISKFVPPLRPRHFRPSTSRRLPKGLRSRPKSRQIVRRSCPKMKMSRWSRRQSCLEVESWMKLTKEKLTEEKLTRLAGF